MAVKKPASEPISIHAFTTTQLYLLQQELQTELQETASAISLSSPAALQRAGLAIINLILLSQRTGLGGKTVVELGPDPATSSGTPPSARSGKGGAAALLAGSDLQEHGLRIGDIVLVSEQPAGSAKKREIKELEGKGQRGVVTKAGRGGVCIALDNEEGEGMVDGKRLWVVKLADEVTFKRMSQVLSRMQKMDESEYSSFVRVMFGLSSASTDQDEMGTVDWIDQSLNESQKEAIRFALISNEVALIHGPPGTGKTHTLIELILQLLRRGQRILVCGPSNISVDNIVERLAPHKLPVVRLGHPARLLPSVLNHSLDVLTQTSDAAAIVQDIRNEMDAKQASIKKTKSGRERKGIWNEIRELRKEYREREGKVVTDLVGTSKVVCATLHGAGGWNVRDEVFDVVIIDEASQALEAQCWVPLIRAKKVVLAGDHLQLPPTIKSLNSKTRPIEQGNGDENADVVQGMTLETTLFDRLLAVHGEGIKRMLTTQYRMHAKIMRFPSDQLYEGKLIAAEAVQSRTLAQLEYGVQESEDTIEPLIFFDTQGGDFPERLEDDAEGVKKVKKAGLGESKSNLMEAYLVKSHVGRLVNTRVKEEDIAVISPYNAQVSLLSSLLKEAYPALELGSIDGFQGREKEVVIISLVRSNAEREVGFLGEKRRLNVAMTRPKRSLVVVGDSETLGSSGNKFLKEWLRFLEEEADLRYPDVGELE